MDDFSPATNIAWNGYTGVVEYGGGDRNMVCLFYNKPVPNAAKAAKNGRPSFENKIYVRIHPVGERLNIVDREATDRDKMRFAMQWNQFRQRKEQVAEGMPIELLYPEQPVISATLRASAVQTVEQLAELSAPAIENIGMGCQTWVNYAKKVLATSGKIAKDTGARVEIERLTRELKVKDRQIDQLKDAMAQMQERMTNVPDMQTMQAMMATMMQRPQHMPQQAFDAQTAMINGTDDRAQKSRQRPRLKR
jgi:hypothetical protein